MHDQHHRDGQLVSTTLPERRPGTLVSARGREWLVLPGSTPQLVYARPLGGADDESSALLPALEAVTDATFDLPSAEDRGDATRARLLRDALRLSFRNTAGPFRSFASLAVSPRNYQLVPLIMSAAQDTTRLLIADGVGVGKTIEAGLIAAELLATGEATRLAVLCSPQLAPQWQAELRSKFGINAELLGQQGRLGCVAAGAIADLLVIDGDPLEDITLLQHEATMPVVMKAGAFHRRAGFPAGATAAA